MVKKENIHVKFGLVGRNISYSFSRTYFSKKFDSLGLRDHSYENFDLPRIEDFSELIAAEKYLKGLNVTIPYKEQVIPYLNGLHPAAGAIGAVNTIHFTANGLEGHNTDVYGFEGAIRPLLKDHHKKALVLGTGGAAKAVAYGLKILRIPSVLVSRKPSPGILHYRQLHPDILNEYLVLVNCTPLGTYPHTTEKPDLPYDSITSSHLLFDLVYNPPITAFMKEGLKRNATVSNGLRMLQLQAEKAWEVWHSGA